MNPTSETQDQEKKWEVLCRRLEKDFGKVPSLEGMLFLIGLREMGKGPGTYSKEEKQDLMHVATCTILSPPFAQHYRMMEKNQDGWPQFECITPLPAMNLEEQEIYLKERIVSYFGKYYSQS